MNVLQVPGVVLFSDTGWSGFLRCLFLEPGNQLVGGLTRGRNGLLQFGTLGRDPVECFPLSPDVADSGDPQVARIAG